MTRPWSRLRYFPSRQINFHRDTPPSPSASPPRAARAKAAGRTIENLARGRTRISRFTAPPMPTPCFRCPRGRRHVYLSTSVSARLPRYPTYPTAIYRPPPPQRDGAYPCVRVPRMRACTCVCTCADACTRGRIYVLCIHTRMLCTYVRLSICTWRYTPPP